MNALATLVLLLNAAVVRPVLEFPEPGLDDSSAYAGYRTRIFRDTGGNAVQVYLDQRSGRVVLMWADAADEAAAFTARDTAGAPAALDWGSATAEVSAAGPRRSVTWRLRLPGRPVALGHYALGSMRWERDLQYQNRHLEPFDSKLPRVPELEELVIRLGGLDAAERYRHLKLLAAPDLGTLRARLEPTVELLPDDSLWTVRIGQSSFDGRNHLTLELRGRANACAVRAKGSWVLLQPRGNRPFSLAVRVRTDAASLTPIGRERIFNAEFLAFHERVRREGPASRFRRIERQVRGVELLSYQEKLMAGLPNFATYFGRDMMMAALMMEQVWLPGMLEHVVGSALGKLSPDGAASHEEALGGQAIREHAAEYGALLASAETAAPGARDSLLGLARSVLQDLGATRESYHMVDESFQLPVLAARYLARADVTAGAKRTFLLAPARPGGTATRLEALLKNFGHVVERAAPYARTPEPVCLVSFPGAVGGAWSSGSWRDSRAGYAGGRFAMDVNVVWVPMALRAIETCLGALQRLSFSTPDLVGLAQRGGGTPLAEFMRDASALARARKTWAGAERWFEVRLGAAEARARIAAWLAGLPEPERRHWGAIADTVAVPDTLRFLALSLDEAGRSIPVMNTDPASLVFLDEPDPARAVERIGPLMLPYPVGLLVSGLGPLVANDAFASRAVWDAFRADAYHSPRVVWGREVELLVLGLARQLRDAGSAPAAVRTDLERHLARVREAARASGLEHAELWSYRIEGGALRPERYGSSSDVQLWSLTDLAVQFALERDGSAP